MSTFPFNLALQSLSVAQQAYSELRTRYRILQREHSALSSTQGIKAARSAAGGTLTIDGKIVKLAKQFVIFYQFWVPEKLFPTPSKPNVNLCDPERFKSREKALQCTIVELYNLIGNDMEVQKAMKQYQRFRSLVRYSPRFLS
jgi:hypothetical protein